MATTRAAVDDLLGHPRRAASLSRKETKRIKEWKRRRDEMLAMWARRIRQNAEWQKHVLFSIKPRKKRCLLQIEIGLAADSRQQPLLVRQTEWVTRAALEVFVTSPGTCWACPCRSGLRSDLREPPLLLSVLFLYHIPLLIHTSLRFTHSRSLPDIKMTLNMMQPDQIRLDI